MVNIPVLKVIVQVSQIHMEEFIYDDDDVGGGFVISIFSVNFQKNISVCFSLIVISTRILFHCWLNIRTLGHIPIIINMLNPVTLPPNPEYTCFPWPVGWDCRTHGLLICRGVRPPTTTNECPGYNTKPFDGEVRTMLELWGMWITSSLPLLPGPLWHGMVAPDRVLSMDQIELKWVFMLNWIVLNKTVFTFKLHTYAKLNCLKWNCVCMLNWIAWNRNVFDN